MSLRALPLIVIVFILYNVIVLAGGGAAPEQLFNKVLLNITMLHDNKWVFSLGDLIILLTMVLLFVELLKAPHTGTSQMIDNGLSMLLFIACLMEFLLAPRAASSVFFFVTVAALIDVVAGFTIGIQTAKRDVTFGSTDN